MRKDKKQYIAPALTVVTFKVELGFALSNPTGYQSTNMLDMFLLQSNDNYNNQAQENWHEYNNGGDFFSW